MAAKVLRNVTIGDVTYGPDYPESGDPSAAAVKELGADHPALQSDESSEDVEAPVSSDR